MFEFLVEKETEARKLSEAEASRVAPTLGICGKTGTRHVPSKRQ